LDSDQILIYPHDVRSLSTPSISIYEVYSTTVIFVKAYQKCQQHWITLPIRINRMKSPLAYIWIKPTRKISLTKSDEKKPKKENIFITFNGYPHIRGWIRFNNLIKRWTWRRSRKKLIFIADSIKLPFAITLIIIVTI
jgi:hypothetical protein